MPAPDSSGEQASLTDFTDSESPTGPATADAATVDELEQRVDRLKRLLDQNAETIERVIDTVERVNERIDGLADPEHQPADTDTDPRGYH